MDWTTLFPPLVGALAGGGIAILIARWEMSNRSKGLARAAAKVAYRRLLRQYASLFRTSKIISEYQGDSVATMLKVGLQSVVESDDLLPPPPLEDTTLNDQFTPEFALTNAKYSDSIESASVYLRMLHESLIAIQEPSERADIDEWIGVVLARLSRVMDAISQVRIGLFPLTAWPTDFWLSDEELAVEGEL